jgi:NAD(P)-dependent dehydrogenase (short-subunit alcohol dehydrogenase family)
MHTALRRLALVAAIGAAGSWTAKLWLRRSRRISFQNKIVLITGGSRGLGLVIARQLAAAGARLALCARDAAELARAEAELRHWPTQILTHVCDITRREEAERLVARVEAELGPIDILINNAGVISVGPVEYMNIADYEQAMQIHFWGPLYIIQKVIPSMRARGQGRIVNVASIGGRLSVPHLIPYCASKFAMVGLSRGLRSELAKDGILVTTVSPGLMRTGSPRQALIKGQHQREYAWFSISDSLPALSIRAEQAAAQILDACRHGDSELVISAPAKLAVMLNTLAPELTAEVLAAVNRLLPGMSAGGSETKKGYESESAWSPSWLTFLTEQAAQRNNELPPPSRFSS